MLQRGQIGVHPVHVVACCQGRKNNVGNVRPCWWGPGFLPGARSSDASLWGPGFGPAMAQVCGDWVVLEQPTLAATLGQMRGNQGIPGPHSSWYLHIASFAGVK